MSAAALVADLVTDTVAVMAGPLRSVAVIAALAAGALPLGAVKVTTWLGVATAVVALGMRLGVAVVVAVAATVAVSVMTAIAVSVGNAVGSGVSATATVGEEVEVDAGVRLGFAVGGAGVGPLYAMTTSKLLGLAAVWPQAHNVYTHRIPIRANALFCAAAD